MGAFNRPNGSGIRVMIVVHEHTIRMGLFLPWLVVILYMIGSIALEFARIVAGSEAHDCCRCKTLEDSERV